MDIFMPGEFKEMRSYCEIFQIS